MQTHDHAPCEQVQDLAIKMANIDGKFGTLIKLWGAVVVALASIGSWIVLRQDTQAEELHRCCIEARRFEAVETDVRSAVAELRTLSATRYSRGP